jgi:hypothetical protein
MEKRHVFYCRKRLSVFVCTFGAFFKRVFKGQKICLTYFKICLRYFEICALYFLFAPNGV